MRPERRGQLPKRRITHAPLPRLDLVKAVPEVEPVKVSDLYQLWRTGARFFFNVVDVV